MYRILIIDDNKDFRESLAGSLQDEGYHVIEASTEDQAFDAIQANSFDFAVIDVRLHGEDEEDASGLSLAMAIRCLNKSIHFILMTGYAKKNQHVERAVRYAGGAVILEKSPDIVSNILEVIGQTVSESKPEHYNNTQISFTLNIGQPIGLRAKGSYTDAGRTDTVLQVSMDRYARRAEYIWDSEKLRFEIKDIGKELWRQLVSEHTAVLRMYSTAKGKDRHHALILEGERDYLRLPLEFLYDEDSGSYLVLQHPLTRFVYHAVPRRKAISPNWFASIKELRVLLIASNTTPDIPGVDEEVRSLKKLFDESKAVPVRTTLIPSEIATYQRVRAELRKKQYDIIHYAGHGNFVSDSPEESKLYFWKQKDKKGGLVSMAATDLKNSLEQSVVRLVYLSNCYGSKTGSKTELLDDDYLGLSDAVVHAGVPTILGYRWPVSDSGGARMALYFYKSLLKQGSPEVALWQARQELAAVEPNDPAWISPILIHQV